MGERGNRDKVWIKDPNTVWRVAEVIGFDEKKKELEVASADFGVFNTKIVKADQTMSHDIDHERNFDNAYQMGDLNEASILNLLKNRSMKDEIYTFTGDILLSVNPYKDIPNLYEPMPTISNSEAKGEEDGEQPKPHVYILAQRAYAKLFESGIRGCSQSVLINGESGSGKTEAAKRIMAFLMELSQRKRRQTKKSPLKKNLIGYGAADGVDLSRRKKKKKKEKNEEEKKEDGLNRDQSEIEKIILRTNPIMEAIGNARTIRNDNSSRFGKFVQLEYEQDETIKGAKTRHFLLEKSRVTKHGRGERNYHIFYQLMAAYEANPDDPVFEDLQMLKSAEHYKYLNPEEESSKEEVKKPLRRGKKDALVNDGVQKMAERAVKYLESHKEEVKKMDLEIFQQETFVAFEKINLGVEDQKNIWKVLAAILHLGNLEFETVIEKDKKGKSVQMTAVKEDEVDVHGDPRTTIDLCSELLGVKTQLLADALTRKTFSAGGRASVTEMPLSIDEASKSRDGLAKAIYEALFEWMLDKINIATSSAVDDLLNQTDDPFADPEESKKKSKEKKLYEDVFIGILDIFGFEALEDNSFEQLCINYANETLQGMFDKHVFEIEMEAYEREEIMTENLNLSFRENKSLLELLNKRGTGIFQLMDEQGLRKEGNDAEFFRGIVTNHDTVPMSKKKKKKKKTEQKEGEPAENLERRFAGSEKTPDGRMYFRINHFAGVITYTANGMVAKNADHLQADLADLIAVGGMPKREQAVTKEDIAADELALRMGKSPEQIAAEAAEAEKEDTTNANSFSFLQKILKLREMRAKDKSAENNEDEAKPKKRRVRGRGVKKKNKKMASMLSVSKKFREQMTALQTLLEETEQHFVRCIKPNDMKVPPSEKWDHILVNTQLKMLGALEMVRVRRQGFPIRTNYDDFLEKFPEMCEKFQLEWDDEDESEVRKAAVGFMNKIDKGGKNLRWFAGNRLLLREETIKQLNADERKLRDIKQEKEEKLKRLREREERERKQAIAVEGVQKTFRMYKERKKFLSIRRKVTRVQANFRRRKYGNPLEKYKKAVVLIQKNARRFIVKTRLKNLGNIANVLAPLAKGYISRKKTDVLFNTRSRYKNCLRQGECVVLETECIPRSGKSAKLPKGGVPYSLLLTTGPHPRILYVNTETGVPRVELDWDERVLGGLMANESKLVLYSKLNEDPQDGKKRKSRRKNLQNVHKFSFTQPRACQWLLALKGMYSVYDILNLEKPDYVQICKENPGLTREMIQEHGNVLPLNKKVHGNVLFGGLYAHGGLQKIRKQQFANLNQLTVWRQRFFAVKESTLFWFKCVPGKEEVTPGSYPIGGLTLTTETTINMANTNPHFYQGKYKQKASLEIESRVLKASLKINFASPRFRQQWVNKMKATVRSQLKASSAKRMSITMGVLDTKGFMKIAGAEELLAPTVLDPELESQVTGMNFEEEEAAEDIEQGIVEEIF